MKKILLTFLGMIVFAHMAYARYYKIILGDWYGANINIYYSNSQNPSNDKVKNWFVPSSYQSYCTVGGGTGDQNTASNQTKITCNLRNSNLSPFVFWHKTKDNFNVYAQDRCVHYVGHVVQNSDMYCTEKASETHYGIAVKGLAAPSGWTFNKDKGLFLHNLSIKVYSENIGNSSYLEWTGTLRNTALGPSDFAARINDTQYGVKCRDVNGNQLSGFHRCYQTGASEVSCDKQGCTSSGNGAVYANVGGVSVPHIEYDSKAYSDAAHNRLSNQTSTVKKYTTSVGIWMGDGFSPEVSTANYGVATSHNFDITHYVMNCKKFYSQWIGTRKDGKCYGTYWVTAQDADGVFSSMQKLGVYNAADAKSTAESNYNNEVSCPSFSHDTRYTGDNPGRCSCKNDTFYTEARCKNHLTNQKYCTSVANASTCKYKLNSCGSGRYTASDCGGVSASQYCKNNGDQNPCYYSKVDCASGEDGSTYSEKATCEYNLVAHAYKYCADKGSSWNPKDHGNQCRYQYTNCAGGTYRDNTNGKDACDAKVTSDGATTHHCQKNNGGNCPYKVWTCSNSYTTKAACKTAAEADGTKYCKNNGSNSSTTCQYQPTACSSNYSSQSKCTSGLPGNKYCTSNGNDITNATCAWYRAACADQTFTAMTACTVDDTHYCKLNQGQSGNQCPHRRYQCGANLYMNENACKSGINTGTQWCSSVSGDCPYQRNTCPSGRYRTADACNAVRNGDGAKVCENKSSENSNCPYVLRACDTANGRYSTSAACQTARGTSRKAGSAYLTKWCATDTSDACNYHLTTKTDTVSSCDGDTKYIDKYDSNRACQKK